MLNASTRTIDSTGNFGQPANRLNFFSENVVELPKSY